MQNFILPITGPRPWKIFFLLSTALLSSFIFALVALPPLQAEAIGYVATGIATIGSSMAASLFFFRATGSVRYRWALVAAALVGRGINYLVAADSEIHAHLPRSVGFWFLGMSGACFLLAVTAVDVAGSRLIRFLDVFLVLVLCLLRYTIQWGGGGTDIFATQAGLYLFFLLISVFLLVAAGIAVLAAVDAEEAQFARLMLLYFFLLSISSLCANQFSLWSHKTVGSPWFLATTLGELIFIFAVLRSLRAQHQPALRPIPSLLARGTMPVFLGLATVGMGIALLSTHFRVGVAAIVTGILCYATRMIFMHRHFVLAQNDLLSRNNHLEDLLDRDPLTGVGNRRSLTTAIDHHCAEAHLSGQSVFLLLLDIDGFRQANDAVGQVYGDRCLLAIASALARELRPVHHHLARYGGDEFAVVLRSPGREQALKTADYLRLACSELQLGASGRMLSLSIGVAQATLPAAMIGHLLEAADRALHRAKSYGRNRVEFESDLAPSTSPDTVRL